MLSIQQPWSVGCILMCFFSPVTVVAFIRPIHHSTIEATVRTQQKEQNQQQRHKQQSMMMIVDPNDIASAVSDVHQHHHGIESISTLLSSTLQPAAHGHSNPMFGPPDPFLTAGKSIAPSVKSLAGMDITPLYEKGKTATDILPDSSAALQETVQKAMDKGWHVLNGNNFKNGGGTHLPGFSETRGILPMHNPSMPAETPESFAGQVQWAASFLNVVDKLPSAALWYALVEFFILRPGIDLYTEDIDDDPSGVVAETVVVTGVRVIALALIGMVTCGIFG